MITLADLGKLQNRKTDVSTALSKGLDNKNTTLSIVCRSHKYFGHKNTSTLLPFGRLAPYALKFLEKHISSSFNARSAFLSLADSYTSGRVKNADIVYFIPPFFPETIKNANDEGATTIIHGGVAHYKHNYTMKKRIGINKKPSKKYKKSVEQSDYVFALSSFVKNTYVNYGYEDKNVFTTQIGVDTDRYRPKDRDDDVFRIICVGNYTKLKGFQYVIKAFISLRLDNAKLIVLGKPAKCMQKIVNQAKEKQNITIACQQNPIPFYRKSSILIHPSLSDGWGKVVTEAMSCGLPVIVSKFTGAKDAVRNGKDGFVLEKVNVSNIRNKIKYFYENRSLALKMGKNARSNVENKFSWGNYSDRVNKALSKVIKTH